MFEKSLVTFGYHKLLTCILGILCKSCHHIRGEPWLACCILDRIALLQSLLSGIHKLFTVWHILLERNFFTCSTFCFHKLHVKPTLTLCKDLLLFHSYFHAAKSFTSSWEGWHSWTSVLSVHRNSIADVRRYESTITNMGREAPLLKKKHFSALSTAELSLLPTMNSAIILYGYGIGYLLDSRSIL